MSTITFQCKLCEKSFEIKMPSYLPECYGDTVSELVFFLHLVKHHLKEGKVLKQFFILLKYTLKSVVVTIVILPVLSVIILYAAVESIFEFLYNW